MSYMKRFLEDVAEELGLDLMDPEVLEVAQDRLESGNLPQATVQRRKPPLDIDGFSVRRDPITGKPDYS